MKRNVWRNHFAASVSRHWRVRDSRHVYEWPLPQHGGIFPLWVYGWDGGGPGRTGLCRWVNGALVLFPGMVPVFVLVNVAYRNLTPISAQTQHNSLGEGRYPSVPLLQELLKATQTSFCFVSDMVSLCFSLTADSLSVFHRCTEMIQIYFEYFLPCRSLTALIKNR